jgi:isopenicillin N synthase-like dioxygenase
MSGIQTLSLEEWTSNDPSRRAVFVRQLGPALEAHGFVIIANPGLDPDLLRRAYQAAADLFALSDADKRPFDRPAIDRQRGWTPFGTEHAKDQVAADLKEFWQIGREAPHLPGVPANVFPDEPDVAPVFTALFAALERTATQLLAAVGHYLGLNDGTFEAMTDGGNSVLRVIHYPPLPESMPAGAVRAAAHEDINLMTLLPTSTASGLEIRARDPDGTSRWMPVEAPPGSLIVDTGDMMARLTAGRLPATTHRVVNPTDPALARSPRYSMPFFVHPRPEVRLTPFDGGEPGPTAEDFLKERLRAIGVSG